MDCKFLLGANTSEITANHLFRFLLPKLLLADLKRQLSKRRLIEALRTPSRKPYEYVCIES
jgi:hypothetical protein